MGLIRHTGEFSSLKSFRSTSSQGQNCVQLSKNAKELLEMHGNSR